MLSPDQQQKIIQALLSKKQNAVCADCNAKYPSWASLDFGIFVCMNCSGAHRALGPSITRVKSTKLDSWNRQWVQNMKIGNSILNLYWQKQLSGLSRTVKPCTETSLSDIIKFVQDKYVKKKYIDSTYNLDPLKRSKLPQSEPEPQQKQIKVTTTKEPPKSTMIKKQISFQSFITLPKNKSKPKQPKVAQNLISFDIVDNQTKSQQVHKYNHQNYHTASQVNHKPSNGNLINFQQLSKHHSDDHYSNNATNHSAKTINQNPNMIHQNYLMSQNGFHPNQYATNSQYNHYHSNNHYNPHQQYNTHSVPQYDKAQYVTMNINMNMYPKVMNINMAPYSTGNHNPNSYANQMQQHNPTITEKPQFNSNINLESNIRLDVTNDKPQSQSQKSWIDDWK